VVRQEVSKPTPEDLVKRDAVDCPACNSPMELDLKRRLKNRKDNYAPIIRRWVCACGMTLTTRGRRDVIDPTT